MFSAALRGYACHSAFQNFQQCLLHAFATDIPCDGYVFAFLCDLIDLVDIDDTTLCTFNIIICNPHEHRRRKGS